MNEQFFYLKSLLGVLLFIIGFSMSPNWKCKVVSLPAKILKLTEFELTEEDKKRDRRDSQQNH